MLCDCLPFLYRAVPHEIADGSDACVTCRASFTLINRKLYCRRCERFFCYRCYGSKFWLAWLSAQYCDECTDVIRREDGLDARIQLLQEGAMFVRHLPNGGDTKIIWVSLSCNEDKGEACIQWRSPELVRNVPKDAEEMDIFDFEIVRGVAAEDSVYFKSNAAASERELCFILVGASNKNLVLEATTSAIREEWMQALTDALEILRPKLLKNKDQAAKDSARRTRMEDRKKEADKRRAEMAKGGMKYTAMAMMKKNAEK